MFARPGKGICLSLVILSLPAVGTAAPVDHVDVIDGRVKVTRVGEFDLVVMIDYLPNRGDGIADQAFAFRSAEALPSDLHDLEAAARVAVRREALVLMPAGERNLVFTVAQDDGRRNGFVDAMQAQAIFVGTGYQLTRVYDRPGENLEVNAYQALRVDPFAKSVLIGECCDGGQGEPDCSCNGCSVTCGGGYYACCTSEGCHCEKEVEN
jgi:hypothetical protein